ncbi:sugar ABC transporter substrate-binding protein [Cohnella faecalis]|uniref:Maltose ABC transporter substrate-binding protein n=2 Tax=Cohnella faecalis TaxID=2315694 RepID=A0A398CF10_9BACL|nr:maltose ABC transporter substrate-binding protein [Cohnella faecalis]RIE01160.1 maltose ABC transporter substrate-binding protein [Cohnella faecalis]
MKTDGQAGTAADILTQPHNDLGNAVKSGFVLPNDYYEEQTREEFIQPAVDAVTNNGVLYGYPRNMETYALFVNKDLVKDAPLNTWDDIIAFAKSFNDIKNNKYGYMSRLDTLYFLYPFFSGYGGYVFGNNGTNPDDIGLNNEGSVEGMKFFRTLKEILPMAPADASDDIKTSLFQDGKLAINLDGVWNIGNFSKLGFNATMIPLPTLPNGKTPISFAGVKAYYVSAYSKYPNAAKLFARYVTSKDALLKNFEMSGFIPARKGMAEESAIKNNEMVVSALKQLENSMPMPSIIEMNSVWVPIQQAMELIWNGGDVKASLDKAVDDIRIGISTQND